MRRLPLLVIGCALGLTGAAACWVMAPAVVAATPSTPRLRVTPTQGGARTTFTVHFTAPAPSGTSGGTGTGTIRSYSLTASPARARHGCIASVSTAPAPTRAQQAMAVRLNPGHLGGRWCLSTYSGQVTETIRPNCGPPVNGTPVACPEYVAIERIGSFRFKVTG